MAGELGRESACDPYPDWEEASVSFRNKTQSKYQNLTIRGWLIPSKARFSVLSPDFARVQLVDHEHVIKWVDWDIMHRWSKGGDRDDL
jgi:hypothetical protein